MLTVDLGQLGREGSVVVEGEWSGDDELWKDTSFSWVGQLALEQAQLAAQPVAQQSQKCAHRSQEPKVSRDRIP